ncbi:TetR/AcrR family transcriptional regulator [Couchioplanes caeruleus]|uniref:TetR family transcriptional regulator n=2 Tax=Couchioplanes caeruleus TaxID=56438 RepID=A0A1K0FCE7_9ACTN|nr:TetR family transcriptional regulator [Couchioplanes caeruleus]OJF10519.1 TetR family transcriptional regulator [Couchioplanes caeruleus subsp. caeruleus]ROP28611.1 TetR family transcriptional regulator [Couchioplanes caeruleus]
MPTDRFAVLTDAAIDLLAERGMRGLTHRAVDAGARVPQGTTSAYFRTRKALIEAVVRRIADLDRVDLAESRPPLDADAAAATMADVDAAAAGIAVILDRWMSTARNRTLARYACLLEATHHPELRTILRHGDASRAQARSMLAAAGARDPARAGDHLVACIDGLLLDRLIGAGARTAPAPGTAANRADLTMAITTLLRAFVGEAGR